MSPITRNITNHFGDSFLRFTSATKPWPSRYLNNTIAGLMDSHITITTITINQWILLPTAFVATDTTASDHLLHCSNSDLKVNHTAESEFKPEIDISNKEKKDKLELVGYTIQKDRA